MIPRGFLSLSPELQSYGCNTDTATTTKGTVKGMLSPREAIFMQEVAG